MRGLAALALLLAWPGQAPTEGLDATASHRPEWSLSKRLGPVSPLGQARPISLMTGPGGTGLSLLYSSWHAGPDSSLEDYWMQDRDGTGNWGKPVEVPFAMRSIGTNSLQSNAEFLVGRDKIGQRVGLRRVNGEWKFELTFPNASWRWWPVHVRDGTNGELWASWLEQDDTLHKAKRFPNEERWQTSLVTEDAVLMASAESGDWAVRQRLSDTGERPEWLVEAIRYWPVDESPTGQSANWRILARDSSGNVFGFVASKGGATPVVAWLVSAGNGLYEVWGASIGPGGDESPARLLDKTAWAYRGGVFAVSDLMVVAADSMGGFVLWWNESGLNGSKVDQAGNWSSLPVLDAQGRSDNTAFLPLHSGRLLAVWTSGRGHWPCEGTLMSAALTPGEEWSEPTPISRSCWGAYDPVVGVDPAGSVVAVWAYGTVLGSYMWSATLEN